MSRVTKRRGQTVYTMAGASGTGRGSEVAVLAREDSRTTPVDSASQSLRTHAEYF
jgi:hypothetical protein